MLHHFYAQLCPECAALNYEKRTQLAPLHGRVVLVTGARVKVGFQVAAALRPHPHPSPNPDPDPSPNPGPDPNPHPGPEQVAVQLLRCGATVLATSRFAVDAAARFAALADAPSWRGRLHV